MIYLDSITKIYDKSSKKALDNISVHIKPKEFVIFVGLSGAGKSTLTKLITHEEEPTSGKITVGGIDYSSLKKKDLPYLRRKIGVVFQDFKLLPKKTVYENISYALEVAGISNKTIRSRLPQILKMVGLEGKKDAFPRELSGGEKQRVSIARALVHEPKILIADEPTGNLDPKNAWEVIDLLLKVNEYGTTVILTTHNKEIVNALKKRVVTLKNGKLIKDQEVGRYALQ
ncbi:cell division ATP-binding protein FtsE [candidate division WS5 bacterium]|uniref:Cell division ATP-binding protein FtsE n=1 Tax=candidate division WS5 bacterium TaxID=2093353 RepID=A0A419DA26_9BACT|nr:MAG: cell division ATP-binding protein FtsE [candidate division WS5 bacterium]